MRDVHIEPYLRAVLGFLGITGVGCAHKDFSLVELLFKSISASRR
jgi:hypothetical protein